LAHQLRGKPMMRAWWLGLVLCLGCADEGIQQDASDCAGNEILVEDVCTMLGPADECTAEGDVCIALCDNLTSCAMPGSLRPLNGFPTAPHGYCVECTQP
jgi:hypothetical protein